MRIVWHVVGNRHEDRKSSHRDDGVSGNRNRQGWCFDGGKCERAQYVLVNGNCFCVRAPGPGMRFCLLQLPVTAGSPLRMVFLFMAIGE